MKRERVNERRKKTKMRRREGRTNTVNEREAERWREGKEEGGQFGGGVIQRMRGTALPPSLLPLLLRVEIHPSGSAADICVEHLGRTGRVPVSRSDSSNLSGPLTGSSGPAGGSVATGRSSFFILLPTHTNISLFFFKTQNIFRCWF